MLSAFKWNFTAASGVPIRRASAPPKGAAMKMSLVLSAAFAASLLVAGLAPTPADAACYGRNCYGNHYKPYRYSHKHWNKYYSQDYRQWREYGGDRRGW
jgi:hypothetical protein